MLTLFLSFVICGDFVEPPQAPEPPQRPPTRIEFNEVKTAVGKVENRVNSLESRLAALEIENANNFAKMQELNNLLDKEKKKTAALETRVSKPVSKKVSRSEDCLCVNCDCPNCDCRKVPVNNAVSYPIMSSYPTTVTAYPERVVQRETTTPIFQSNPTVVDTFQNAPRVFNPPRTIRSPVRIFRNSRPIRGTYCVNGTCYQR